jgi:hypothetical protein
MMMYLRVGFFLMYKAVNILFIYLFIGLNSGNFLVLLL